MRKPIRRPGNLLGGYWFGDANATPPGMIASKLEEIRLANIQNKTPITNGQIQRRIAEHMNDPKALMRKT